MNRNNSQDFDIEMDEFLNARTPIFRPNRLHFEELTPLLKNKEFKAFWWEGANVGSFMCFGVSIACFVGVAIVIAIARGWKTSS